MKRLLFSFAALLIAASMNLSAQISGKYFNSLAIGVSAGTEGIGADVALPIGGHFAIRGGVTIMPNVTYDTDFDVTASAGGYSYSDEITVSCGIKRTTGNVILNIYPSKKASFFICGGVSFSGSTVIGLSGHLNNYDASTLNNLGIEIGDYRLPIDNQGNVSGGIKVASTRPYVGIGFGRAVPHKRVGLMLELGAQFQKKPEVFSNNGDVSALAEAADDDWSKYMDKAQIYPVVKLRLCGRIF